MRVFLTQGHAQCAVRQYDHALKSYENCLNMAQSVHDVAHQTKALVNIAALHTNLSKSWLFIAWQ